MKIGLIGGSFDPPTNSHQAIINGCLKQKLVDDVWIIPSCNHRQKTSIASYEQRCHMCTLMFKRKDSSVFIWDKFNVTGSSFELINMLTSLYTQDFCFIIGRDQADNIDTWYKYKTLIKTVPFIVVERGNYLSSKNADWFMKEPHQHITLPDCDFSSTFVRKLLQSESYNLAKCITHKKVIDYIKKEGLYK